MCLPTVCLHRGGWSADFRDLNEYECSVSLLCGDGRRRLLLTLVTGLP